jgi:TetR/AcrR family transcriptional regulator
MNHSFPQAGDRAIMLRTKRPAGSSDGREGGLDTNDTQTTTVVRRRRQQRSIDTRLKIVKAALSEFAKYGFDGASTRGIAQVAEVPHSLVIHHFKGKDDLWHATVRETVKWYIDRVFLPDDDGKTSPAERLRHYFAEYIRFSASHPDFFRMMTLENTLNSERLQWLVEHHVDRTVVRVTAIIVAAQAEGTFASGDPIKLLYMFLGAATSPYRSSAELKLLTGKSPAAPAQVEEHIRTCERLFFREPETKPGRKAKPKLKGKAKAKRKPN